MTARPPPGGRSPRSGGGPTEEQRLPPAKATVPDDYHADRRPGNRVSAEPFDDALPYGFPRDDIASVTIGRPGRVSRDGPIVHTVRIKLQGKRDRLYWLMPELPLARFIAWLGSCKPGLTNGYGHRVLMPIARPADDGDDQ